jgi:hypothetical protein
VGPFCVHTLMSAAQYTWASSGKSLQGHSTERQTWADPRACRGVRETNHGKSRDRCRAFLPTASLKRWGWLQTAKHRTGKAVPLHPRKGCGVGGLFLHSEAPPPAILKETACKHLTTVNNCLLPLSVIGTISPGLRSLSPGQCLSPLQQLLDHLRT